ncbi:MAG TPA: class II aldolase/adducin family protein [Acidimicrobiia bacterium]|nr:class II aldolase/adducin family protein [Acidimicrobiia bacterium]
MTDDALALKQSVLDTAKQLYRKGLVEGTSGNVSGRMPDGRICITPSSLSYEDMTLDDLVVIDLDGQVVEGERSPSSEKSVHLACYREYEEVGGVIHSHPVHATMFALTGTAIPAAIDEFSIYIGGEVPVCEYHPSGTDALGDEVARNLKDRSAALMANHGLATVGPTPEKALHAALVVERSAHIIWGARALGTVIDLPEKTNADFVGVYKWMRENRV